MRLLAPRPGLLLVFVLAAGCSQRSGHVTGKVTYRGTPVPAGWITFRPADPAKNSIPIELDPEGNFAVDLPAGEVMVSIDNHEWAPRGDNASNSVPHGVPPGIPLSPEVRAKVGANKAPAAPKEDRPKPRPGKYISIPTKYCATETSGIKFTVKGGSQVENIELTD